MYCLSFPLSSHGQRPRLQARGSWSQPTVGLETGDQCWHSDQTREWCAAMQCVQINKHEQETRKWRVGDIFSNWICGQIMCKSSPVLWWELISFRIYKQKQNRFIMLFKEIVGTSFNCHSKVQQLRIYNRRKVHVQTFKFCFDIRCSVVQSVRFRRHH